MGYKLEYTTSREIPKKYKVMIDDIAREAGGSITLNVEKMPALPYGMQFTPRRRGGGPSLRAR